jgi:hypothetical protein
VQSGWGPPQYPPPTGWAKPRIDRSLLRPKAGWYAAAAIPAALGVAATAILVVLAVRAFPDEPRPFTAPARLQIRLEAGEGQTIYSHTKGAEVPSVSGTPSCTVRNLRSERLAPLRQAGNTTISVNENTYVTELDFEPPADGAYLIRCRPAAGVIAQPLALGKSPHLARFGLSIVAAIGSFVLGLLFCGGVIAFVAIRRHSHKRRLEREAAGWA